MKKSIAIYSKISKPIIAGLLHGPMRGAYHLEYYLKREEVFNNLPATYNNYYAYCLQITLYLGKGPGRVNFFL